MSEQEFQSIPWQYGNKVRLTNGKQYTVKKKKKGTSFFILTSIKPIS